nr:unnamed protein product [Naegleria fowleri]
MGNTCAVNQNNNLADEDDFAENGRFNSYLATLPKLFTETTVQGDKYLCTAYVTSNFKSVVFAVADIKKNFYMKQVSRKKLAEIRDRLDVNNTIGWMNFFTALKYAFLNRKVSLKMHVNEEECLFNIDLNFAVIGRTSLSLPLKRDNEALQHLSLYFVNPLYDFYSVRTESAPLEKLEQLEKQIKLYKDKIAEVEREIKEKYPDSSTPEEDDDVLDELVDEDAPAKAEPMKQQEKQPPQKEEPTPPPEQSITSTVDKEEYVNFEQEKVIRFLSDIMKKLSDNNSITMKEKQSFERIISILSHDSQYSVHFNKDLLNEMDMDVLEWAKIKFATNERPIVLRGEDKPIEFMNVEDAKRYLESSQKLLTEPREQILAIFDKLDSWSFDAVELFNATGGNPLFATCFTLFLKYDFMRKFNIQEELLINFLRELEAGYHPNPYHNNAHAADVLQATHFIIKEGGLSERLTDEDCFAALLSATIHDYDHPGLNNAFQVNTRSYLATLYNDRAVLENHHCAQSFELMRQEKFNILSGLSTEQRKDIRETVVEMLLATDMGQHAKIVGKFKGRLEAKADFKAKDDIRLALQIAIKMADVSNPARPIGIALKWTERITEEFFAQGDLERNSGLAISPMMDRATQHVGKGQIAFINYLVTPMYEAFFTIAPKMAFCKKYIDNNKSYWECHAVGDKNDYGKLWWDPPAAEEKKE